MSTLYFKKFFKKNISFLILFFIFFTISTKVFALNEGRANRLFNLEYKSFFIGTIVNDNDENFKIKIDRVFIGDNIKEITVKKFYKYSYSALVPKVDDNIVAVLNRDNTLDLTWIFKATSTNYKTLYLANDLDKNNEDVLLFQKFINNGEYILNLDKDNLNLKNEKSNLNKNIKDKSDNEKLKEINKKANIEFENKINAIYTALKNPIFIVVFISLFLVIVYCLKSRKNFRKEVEDNERKHYM